MVWTWHNIEEKIYFSEIFKVHWNRKFVWTVWANLHKWKALIKVAHVCLRFYGMAGSLWHFLRPSSHLLWDHSGKRHSPPAPPGVSGNISEVRGSQTWRISWGSHAKRPLVAQDGDFFNFHQNVRETCKIEDIV